MTAPGDDWLLSMTCAADGFDHLVTTEAMAAGQVARTGVYEALCGAQVLATSLMTPPGKRCRDCRAILTASTSSPSQHPASPEPERQTAMTTAGTSPASEHLLAGWHASVDPL